ncbi:MAG TPA: outer membrane protein assembly factor BamD, partial [Caulobacteraceae bacterium]|nr:outer membrane protein assembly factor BamD [Caulobacteraceae bacterium]
MFRLPSGRASLILLLVAAVALSGCSVFGKKKKPELAYEERPVDLLYNAGATRLDHHQWNEAVNYFREVERQHPYSEWARRSILMTAYAHYQANDYAEAIADADQFISLYPGNPSTPYAYYLKATCYFEQIVDVGRDQASTSAAGEALREVAKRYPYSEYAADARLKIDMVQDQLAGKEMNIGRYYLRSGNPMGAINRFRSVIDHYQTTSHTPEALYRLVEAYLTVGLVGEAKKNGAVLGYNYPGDPWYQAAYTLLTTKGYRPAIEPNAAGPRGPHFPLFGHHDKGATLPPPVDAPPASTTVSQTEAPAPIASTEAASGQASENAPTQAPAPKKPSGFLH